MRLRRLTAMVLAGMMVSSIALTGCGQSSGESTESIASTAGAGTTAAPSADAGSTSKGSDGEVMELTFWTLDDRKEAAEPIVKEWNDTHEDVKIILSIYNTDGIKDACKIAASSGTLPNMWYNWGGSLGSFYEENGLTYDLTEYAKENDWNNKFNEASLSLCTFNGKLSGYPNSYKAMTIYYKRALFEKCGLEVPTTFEEFEQVCATLKENGITPISTGGLYGWHTMRFVELLVEHYAGAELHDKMNTFEESFNNEAMVQALAKYKEFCDKGYFPEGFATQDPNDTLLALATDQCAMDIQLPSYDAKLNKNDLDPADYGVFAFPSGGTNRMSAFADMTQFSAKNTKEELEACIEFIDFYHSPEIVEKYTNGFSMPLARLDAKMAADQPNVPRIMELSAESGVFLITDQALPTEVADVLFNAQDAIANGQMTPEDGAKNIQAAVEAYLNK